MSLNCAHAGPTFAARWALPSGLLLGLLLGCGGGEGPAGPAPVDAAPGCLPEVEQRCVRGQPHGIDSCGELSPLGPPCGPKEICVEDEAGARCASDCDGPPTEPACRGGDVWAVGHCGAADALVERCPSEGPCEQVGDYAGCRCRTVGIATVCGGPEGGHIVQPDSCGRASVLARCGGAGSCAEGPSGAACTCTPAPGLACTTVTLRPAGGAPDEDVAAVAALDTCGRVDTLVEVCPSGATCDAGAPAGAGCVCAPDVTRACVGDAIYAIDACGVAGALIEACAGGAQCSARDGAPACACDTSSGHGFTCVGDVVHFADSCGGPGPRVARSCATTPCVQIGDDADCGGVLVDVTSTPPGAPEGPDDLLVPAARALYSHGGRMQLRFALADGGPWPTATCTLQLNGRRPSDPVLAAHFNSTGLFEVEPYESQAQNEAAPCGAQQSFFVTCEDAAGQLRYSGSPVILEKRCP